MRMPCEEGSSGKNLSIYFLGEVIMSVIRQLIYTFVISVLLFLAYFGMLF